MPPNQDLVAVARVAAQRAGEVIRGRPRPQPSEATLKGRASDFVTETDRASEQAIRETLLDAYPDSTVLGEELSPDATGEGLIWVVDPLDGTTNYLHGYPAYAVSIGAVRDTEPVAGVVLDVERDLLYEATAGGGAWCGRSRLRVSRVDQPAHALIGTGFPFRWPDKVPAYLAEFGRILVSTAGIRRAGAAALDFVDVASGRLDGFWEPVLAPWDVAAGSVIVREAGGVVTDPAGAPDVLRHGAFVAGNPTIHAWLVQMLA